MASINISKNGVNAELNMAEALHVIKAFFPGETVRPILEWSTTLCEGKAVDYATAEKACAALGDGWRLPSRMELESILDLTRHDPAVDTARFPDTKSTWYWTGTPCAWSSGSAWVVHFLNGYAYNYDRSNRACVRAVRAVSAGQ